MSEQAAEKIATVQPGMQESMANAISSRSASGMAQAREMLQAKRASGDAQLRADGKSPNPQTTHNKDLSEAGRRLAQQAAQARAEKARQAQAALQTQEGAQAPAQRTDDTPNNTAGLETDDDAHLAEQEEGDQTQVEGDSDDADTTPIDLGEGVSLSRTEIRANLLRQADYTRKTQAIAERSKAFEADRTQRLQVLDTLIHNFAGTVGQPKELHDFLAEDPVEGLQKYADQQKKLGQLRSVLEVKLREGAHHSAQARKSTLEALAESHGDNAQTYYDDAINYAVTRVGSDRAALEPILAHPEAIAILHDAKAYRELQANKGKITRMVAGKPLVVKPGTKVSAQANASNRVQTQTAALKASGKLADAVQLLQARRAMNQRG